MTIMTILTIIDKVINVHNKKTTTAKNTMTCDIWDTDYNSDNWEPEFMTIFVIWQLIVTLDSIRNSCDVYPHTSDMQGCVEKYKLTQILHSVVCRGDRIKIFLGSNEITLYHTMQMVLVDPCDKLIMQYLGELVFFQTPLILQGCVKKNKMHCITLCKWSWLTLVTS